MKTINTITDIRQWADDQLSSFDGLGPDLAYSAALDKAMNHLSARASSEGFEYGEDWREFFNGVTSEDLAGMIQ